MNPTFRRLAIVATTALTVSSLAACAGMSRQSRDTAIGATAGAVVGSAVTGTTTGAAIGAAIGGVIGHDNAKKK